MNSKPVIFFIALMIIALALVAAYRLTTNPVRQTAESQAQVQTKADQQNPHMEDPTLTLFEENCASCHGPFGQGNGPNPALRGTKLSNAQIIERIRKGKGRMPAFNELSTEQLDQLVDLIRHL